VDENDGILVIVIAVAEIPDEQTPANARFSRISNIRVLNPCGWGEAGLLANVSFVLRPESSSNVLALKNQDRWRH
jgi:hypothetical protein